MPDRTYEFLDPPRNPGEIGYFAGYRIFGVLLESEMLWEGPASVFFEAWDETLQRPATLRIFNPDLAASSTFRQRVCREAQIMAAVCHENTVKLHAVYEHDGVLCCVLENLEGETLEQRLERKQKLPVCEILRIGRDITRGLAAVHRIGVIHRDIKPASIWLQSEPKRAKILDFTLGRALDPKSLVNPTGFIVGTPAYLSPEQSRGDAVDARSDLFNLGCTLYQMATGIVPFKRATPFSTLTAVANEEPLPPNQHNPDLPPPLNQLILHLLAKSASNRPESAEVVARRIDELYQQYCIAVPEPAPKGS